MIESYIIIINRGAALLIGLWDLLIHSVVLCALVLMFRQPTARLMPMNDDVNLMPNAEPSNTMMMQKKNFLSSNVLLNRIMEKRNLTHLPMPTGINTRNFYSNMDLMTVKWAASLNQRMFINIIEKNVYSLFFVSFFCRR